MTEVARRRRFVSAPAGTYPAPVRPRRAAPGPAPALDPAGTVRMRAPLVPELPQPEADDEIISGAVGGPAFSGNVTPEYDPISAQPATAVADDIEVNAPRAPRMDEVGSFRHVSLDQRPPRPSSWARGAVRRMLLGAVVGGLVGIPPGLAMLALPRPDGLAALKDPVALCRSVQDSREWLMVTLIVVAFALIGAAVGSYTRSSKPARS